MGNNTRNLLIAVVFGVAFMWIFNKLLSNTASTQLTIKEPTSLEMTDRAQSTVSMNESQQGDKCKEHFYYIAPGESASITFETMVDANGAKIANEEGPTVQKADMENVGYSVSYLRCYVDTFSLDLPVWTVSEPDFTLKDNEQLLYVPGGGISISWNRTGEGTITEVPGVNGQFKVGKLTFNELSKKLGGSNSVNVRYSNGVTHPLTPVQKDVHKEFHILAITLHIKTPPKYTGDGRKYGSVRWKGNGIEFHIDYERTNNRYMITGPAISRDCL